MGQYPAPSTTVFWVGFGESVRAEVVERCVEGVVGVRVCVPLGLGCVSSPPVTEHHRPDHDQLDSLGIPSFSFVNRTDLAPEGAWSKAGRY